MKAILRFGDKEIVCEIKSEDTGYDKEFQKIMLRGGLARNIIHIFEEEIIYED